MANTTQAKVPKEDDVLECFLYPRLCYSVNPDHVTEEMLNEEIEKFKDEIETHMKDYIWHRDSLNFRPRSKRALLFDNLLDGSATVSDFEILPHIHATVRFDEDIGDEWFTVYMIFDLTRKFEGLIARLVDSDGEFLLVEAADELPVWATPEACHNRVFVMNGAVHAVHDKQKHCHNILQSIYQRSHLYKMSDKVQAVLHKRMAVYPAEIQRRRHKARAYLPEKAAAILKQEPHLIAAAIRTICHSDPLERKVCRAMKYFPPEQRVMVNVTMTKCMYAMATHCRYTGDPRTGWNLPPSNSSKYNAYLLGIKIACGLEMMVAKAHEERRRKERENAILTNNEQTNTEGRAWTAYIKSLELNGYFKDTLEGSKERDRLLSVARDYFMSHSNLSENREFEESDAEKVLTAWQETTNDIEIQADKDESGLSPADSDSWLNVDPAQLDAMLGHQLSGTAAGKSTEQPMTLRDKVQVFLNQTSGIDGVQFFGDRETESKVDAEDNGRIDFDADVFDSTLRDILDLVVPGSDGEFDGSSEDSLGGDNEDEVGEMEKYMRIMDSELKEKMVKDEQGAISISTDAIESNLMESIENEAGGSGPAGNIIGGPVQRLRHLRLQSPTNLPS